MFSAFTFLIFSTFASPQGFDATTQGTPEFSEADREPSRMYCPCGSGIYSIVEDPYSKSSIELAEGKAREACRTYFPEQGESKTPVTQRREKTLTCSIQPRNEFYCLQNFFNAGRDSENKTIKTIGLTDHPAPSARVMEERLLSMPDPTTGHLVGCYDKNTEESAFIREALEAEDKKDIPDPQWLDKLVEAKFVVACGPDLTGACGKPRGVKKPSFFDQMKCLYDRRQTLRESCRNFFHP